MSELGKHQNEFSRRGKEKDEATHKKVMLILGVVGIVVAVIFGVLGILF